MNEVSCQNCEAVCCKGGSRLLIMQLTSDELSFMQKGGNEFQSVAQPVDYDREQVVYPAGMQIYPEKRTFNWLAEKGKEYEPLPAGFGRHVLIGACKYLVTDENGWEQCSVYEDRPAVCRDLEEGGQKCLGLRALNGVRVPDPRRQT